MGGEATGPNLTDRGKSGTKHHLMTDANGILLSVLVGLTNQHDSVPLEKILDGVPDIRKKRGRSRKLYADKAYDIYRCRLACNRRGMLSCIACRGAEAMGRLGKHRSAVERTSPWIHRYRRPTVRYDHLTFLKLTACLIRFSAHGW